MRTDGHSLECYLILKASKTDTFMTLNLTDTGGGTKHSCILTPESGGENGSGTRMTSDPKKSQHAFLIVVLQAKS